MPEPVTERTYTLAEAAIRCGYQHPTTLRRKHLTTEKDRSRLGFAFDDRGRRILDAEAIDALAATLTNERKRRRDWRTKNLGKWAERGPRIPPTNP